MMLNTKPPGERTKFAHPECYARKLNDCSREANREHFISKTLLKRLGATFTAEGFSWQSGPKTVSPKSLRAWIMCKRHNEALSPLDNRITDLYDLLLRWWNNEPIGEEIFDGEDIERWAIKVMLGHLVSGSARDASGAPGKLLDIPEVYLRVLFGDAELPDGRGFFATEHVPHDLKRNAHFACWDLGYGPDDPHAGAIFGIGMSMLGLTFVTTVLGLPDTDPAHYHRPSEFVVGNGRVQLNWQRPSRPLSIRLHKESA